ncbi:MAG: glycosyl transferase [Acidimicrobiales bacterium]|nr:glycosyl transferase [Acidimicrobiales bacterium]
MSLADVALRSHLAARWPRRLLRVAAAWALAVSASLVPIWPNNSYNQRGGIVLAVVLAVWVGLLTMRPGTRWWGPPAVLVVMGTALAVVPTIGRAAVLVGLGLAVVAHAALVDWCPLPRWPARQHDVALAAVPVVVAAAVAWTYEQPIAVTAVLAAVALAVVEAQHRSVRVVLAADRALRVGLRHAVAGAGAGLGLARKGHASWRALGVGPSVRASLRSAAGVVRRPADRRDRWLAVALLGGFVLRAAWAVAFTAAPSKTGPSDVVGDYYSTMNLRTAEAFASGSTPAFDGIPTAIWPPGTGGLLTPFAWLSEHTGWFELHQAGVAVNVVAGTLTVWFCAALAQRWFGRPARNPAAWIMALAPSHIYITSVAILEPVATALITGAVLAATVAVQDRDATARRRALFAVGVLIGYAVLTTDRAWLLVLVPVLTIRAVDGCWGRPLRTTGVVLAGVAVLVMPWTVRNGVQVGWWSPNATSIPEGMCTVKHGYGTTLTTADVSDPRFLPLAEDCFRGSPFDNRHLGLGGYFPRGWEIGEPHEGEQASRNMSGALRWFATHPRELLAEAPQKLRAVAGNDNTGGFDYASHFGRLSAFDSTATSLAIDAANAWYHLVALLSIVALVRSRRARAAVPLWLIPLVILVQPVLGPYGFSRHLLMGLPFLAILAAGVIGAGGDGGGRTDRPVGPARPAPEAVTG